MHEYMVAKATRQAVLEMDADMRLGQYIFLRIWRGLSLSVFLRFFWLREEGQLPLSRGLSSPPMPWLSYHPTRSPVLGDQIQGMLEEILDPKKVIDLVLTLTPLLESIRQEIEDECILLVIIGWDTLGDDDLEPIEEQEHRPEVLNGWVPRRIIEGVESRHCRFSASWI
jgi:hypothetical protein